MCLDCRMIGSQTKLHMTLIDWLPIMTIAWMFKILYQTEFKMWKQARTSCHYLTTNNYLKKMKMAVGRLTALGSLKICQRDQVCFKNMGIPRIRIRHTSVQMARAKGPHSKIIMMRLTGLELPTHLNMISAPKFREVLNKIYFNSRRIYCTYCLNLENSTLCRWLETNWESWWHPTLLIMKEWWCSWVCYLTLMSIWIWIRWKNKLSSLVLQQRFLKMHWFHLFLKCCRTFRRDLRKKDQRDCTQL